MMDLLAVLIISSSAAGCDLHEADVLKMFFNPADVLVEWTDPPETQIAEIWMVRVLVGKLFMSVKETEVLSRS